MTPAIIGSKTVSANVPPKVSLQKKQNKLGPYTLLQTLGEGEFGKVKLGIHTETGQEVAIKLIKKTTNEPDNHINKIEREISVLKKLQHPYIVKLYSVVETEKYIGLILEYASGGELFEHILAHKYLKEEDAKRLFAQLISSVKYMHDRDIVHRDLKLENLLLDKNRNIVVTDFGFANQFNSEADDLMATTCGSPCYAAPELVINSGLYAGSAVDIWSCGIILYAMLCGFLPFDDDPSNPESDNINQLYRYILSTHVIFPSHINKDVRDLLEKMLVTDPAKRCSLDFIINHSWLTEYHEFLKLDISQLKSKLNDLGKPIIESPKMEKPQLVINTSMSAVIPRRTVGSGVSRTGRRSPRISLMDHHRFAPVTNDKYKMALAQPKMNTSENKKTAPANPKASTFMHFAIRKSYANTAIADATPVSPTATKTLKFSTFITRKPIAKTNAIDSANDSNLTITNDEPGAESPSPQKTLSSSLYGQEYVQPTSLAFGSLRRNQKRGTDKFLSFFTGTKVSQTLVPKEESVTRSNNVPQNSAENHTEHTPSAEQIQHPELSQVEQSPDKERVSSDSDASTIIVPESSLTLSEDPEASCIVLQQGSASGRENTTHESLETHIESTNLETIDENAAENDTSSSHKDGEASQQQNDTASSVSQHDGSEHVGSVQSSAISFKGTYHPSKRDGSSLTSISRNHHYDMASMKSESTVEKDPGPQPEVSSSTRLYVVSNAVSESGRKAIAAVRRGINKKARGIPPIQNQHQLDTVPDKGTQHAAFKPVNSGHQRPVNITPSVSEAPRKKKQKETFVGSETASKRSGMKMMGWMKKKPQPTQKSDIVKEGAVTPVSKIMAEKAPIVTTLNKDTSQASVEEKQLSCNKTDRAQPETTDAKDQDSLKTSNVARKRNRAQSGNNTSLKKPMDQNENIPIHQGAIDRNALTSQSPSTTIKEVARVLRILGIETRMEGDYTLKCYRQKCKAKKAADQVEETTECTLQPVYGDASFDHGDEIRFAVEICRFENLPGLYIVNVHRLKGNAWAYKFLYHKLIDFLYFDKNGYL